jgi:hypothetical protein
VALTHNRFTTSRAEAASANPTLVDDILMNRAQFLQMRESQIAWGKMNRVAKVESICEHE